MLNWIVLNRTDYLHKKLIWRQITYKGWYAIKPTKSNHQNNAIRINYVKTKSDKTQQNSKCRLCGDRDETINHMVSEYSKLAQKEYKSRHDWVGKVIHLELCKKFKFAQTNKYTTQIPSRRMGCTKFSVILRYK